MDRWEQEGYTHRWMDRKEGAGGGSGGGGGRGGRGQGRVCLTCSVNDPDVIERLLVGGIQAPDQDQLCPVPRQCTAAL
jgi:hypothetical protein